VIKRPTDLAREKYFPECTHSQSKGVERGGEPNWTLEEVENNNRSQGRVEVPSQDVNHDEDVLAIADDNAGPLLPIEQVDAICWKIEKHLWGIYRKDGLIFHFEVIEPVQFGGTKLKMYVQCKPEWKRRPMPKTAKLYECASAALGRPPSRHDSITSALWLNRLFRCAIRPAKGTDGKFYSVIHKLIERRA